MLFQKTPASTALREILSGNLSRAFLDVRSEVEFLDGHLSRFLNAPILTNEERHAVGTCYKQRGQADAIELGLRLTESLRESRVRQWLEKIHPAENVTVCCWRGGLRSQYASEWLRAQAGSHSVSVVEGGYKAMRSILLQELEHLPSLTVIAGSTGSRKTEMLKSAPGHALDFEAFAHHRGSAFGGYDELPQPAQATFENRVFLRLHELRLQGKSKVLVEDESIMVGRCTIPARMKDLMNVSDTVLIEASAEERIAHLVEEYALDPLREGKPAAQVVSKLRRDVLKLQKGLGGMLTAQVVKLLEEAFSADVLNPERHREWVSRLLLDYYDRQYAKSLQKWSRKVIFRGTFQECEEWIQRKWALEKRI